jgi:restriction system protein
MSECGPMRAFRTSKGLRRYEMTVQHRALGKYQVIRGGDRYVVEQKARAKMKRWDEMWQRRQEAEAKRQEREARAKALAGQKALAKDRTQEAQNALAALERVLVHTLDIDDTVDWEALKDCSEYTEPEPEKPPPLETPPEPKRSDAKYEVKLGILDKLVASRKEAKEREAEERFEKDHQKWEEEKERFLKHHQAQTEEYEAAMASWKKERDAFLKAQAERNAAIDAQKNGYLSGDAGAIVDYCDLALANSEYPDYFPQSYELDYNPENKILIVDYQLPSLSELPTLVEVKYVQSRDEFTGKHVSRTPLNRSFNNLLYQITLRTIHELYEADQIDALASIVFNGYVRSIDSATGQEVNPCVLSVQAGKEEFERISLANVDPKACFKGLKGIGSTKLQSMTPIAPILKIEREDARFIEGYGVVDGLEEGDNLAAMDWEDFEHLIREEFSRRNSAALAVK